MAKFPEQARHLWVGVATTVFSSILLFWCLKKIQWQEFLQNIENARWAYLGLAFLVTFFIIVAKAAQIRVYLPQEKKISFRRVFQTVAILLMTVSLIPFWGGHALFVYLLGQREKVGKTLALSIITLDQILDGFGKIAVFAAVAFFVPLPAWMREGVKAFVLLFLIAYGLAFILAYSFRTHPEPELGQSRGLKRAYFIFKAWAFHLRAIRDPKKIFLVIAYSIFFRVLETLAVFLVQKSFGLELPIYSSLLLVAALSLATVLPLAPGRLGVFEAAGFATYQYLGVDATTAMTLAIFIHLVHSLPFIFTGYIVSLKTGFKRSEVDRNLSPSVAMSPAEP